MRRNGMRLILALLPAIAGVQGKGEDPALLTARKALIPDLIAALREPAYYSEIATNPNILWASHTRTGVGLAIELGESAYIPDSMATPDNLWIGQTLVGIGKPAIPALIKALETDNEKIQEEVVFTLGRLNAKESFPALKAAYHRAVKPRQKEMIMRTASEVGGKDAFEFVLQTLDEENAGFILGCLGDTQDPRAIPTLQKYLLQGDLNVAKNSIDLSRMAAHALTSIGKPALPLLTRVFRGDSKPLRVVAGDAIGYADDPAFIPLIIEVLESPEARKDEITPGIFRHKDIEAHLVEMLKSNDLPRQLVAARAMEYSEALSDTSLYAQFLRGACQAVPGESREDRRELLIRLADFEGNAKYKKPAPAIRTAIEWMLGPGGYAPSEVAPLLDRYADNAQPNDTDLMFRLVQSKPDPRSGSAMSEESGMTTEDHAAQCLGNLGQSAMERLRELWKNGKVGDDAYATAILFTSEPGAFPLLEEATKSTNEQICEYGLKALGRYKANAKAASLLLPFVESPNERFAAAAHESLVDIGHKDTIRGISKEKYPPYYLDSALNSLDEVFLRELLVNSSTAIKALVAAELVDRGSPDSLEIFTELAEKCQPMQKGVPQALAYLKANEKLFRKCLTVKSTYVRAIAYLRLSRMLKGDRDAYPY